MRYDRIKPETVVEKHVSIQNRRRAFKQSSTDLEEPRVSQKARHIKFLFFTSLKHVKMFMI